MSDLSKLETAQSKAKLYHVKTKKSFNLPDNNTVIFIGKPENKNYSDIDVSDLPNQEVVSRLHGVIEIQDDKYYIKDLGSSNGTYVNKIKLLPHENYLLKFGDKIELGKDGKMSFILQRNNSKIMGQKIEYSFTKILGAVLMTAGVIILADSTRIGFFMTLPGVLLSLIGVYFLIANKQNTLLGWIFLILGICAITISGGLFIQANLLSLIVSLILGFTGYQLFKTGKILNHTVSSLLNIFKK